jgi:hypothetical protein
MMLFQVNFTSGRYFSGNAKEASTHLPFDVGFEVSDTPTYCSVQNTHIILLIYEFPSIVIPLIV